MKYAPITGDAVVNAIRTYMLSYRNIIDNLLPSTDIAMEWRAWIVV